MKWRKIETETGAAIRAGVSVSALCLHSALHLAADDTGFLSAPLTDYMSGNGCDESEAFGRIMLRSGALGVTDKRSREGVGRWVADLVRVGGLRLFVGVEREGAQLCLLSTGEPVQWAASKSAEGGSSKKTARSTGAPAPSVSVHQTDSTGTADGQQADSRRTADGQHTIASVRNHSSALSQKRREEIREEERGEGEGAPAHERAREAHPPTREATPLSSVGQSERTAAPVAEPAVIAAPVAALSLVPSPAVTVAQVVEVVPVASSAPSASSAIVVASGRGKRGKPAPVVDVAPTDGPALRVYRAIVADAALAPIVRAPGALAARLVALCEGSTVDPVAEVIAAGDWQARNARWRDGSGALVKWVKEEVEKARLSPAATPARTASGDRVRIDYQGRRVFGAAALPPGSVWDKTKEEHEAEEDEIYRRAFEATQPKGRLSVPSTAAGGVCPLVQALAAGAGDRWSSAGDDARRAWLESELARGVRDAGDARALGEFAAQKQVSLSVDWFVFGKPGAFESHRLAAMLRDYTEHRVQREQAQREQAQRTQREQAARAFVDGYAAHFNATRERFADLRQRCAPAIETALAAARETEDRVRNPAQRFGAGIARRTLERALAADANAALRDPTAEHNLRSRLLSLAAEHGVDAMGLEPRDALPLHEAAVKACAVIAAARASAADLPAFALVYRDELAAEDARRERADRAKASFKAEADRAQAARSKPALVRPTAAAVAPAKVNAGPLFAPARKYSLAVNDGGGTHNDGAEDDPP